MRILSIQNQFPHKEALKYGLFGGVGHYRQELPAKYLPEHHFTHVGKELMNITSVSELSERLKVLIASHDLIYTKYLDNGWTILCLLSWCKDFNKSLIVDFDDNNFSTDGLTLNEYVYPRDSDAFRNLETLLHECTAVTVSTENLIGVLRQFKDNVHLCPNFCDVKEWDGLRRKKYNRLTIGWAASLSHVPDHEMMIPVYKEIVKKYPEVIFSFCGHYLPPMIENIIPRKNWELKNGIGWWSGHPSGHTYPKTLAEQGYDIGLAPLIPSQFNAARSLVKWFEYSMLEIPTICSDYGPYSILKKEEALKCKTSNDWIQAISILIENKDLREIYGERAKQSVIRKYSPGKVISTWREVFSKYSSTGFRADARTN